MNPRRFESITSRYGSLKLVVLGDVCLDRYFEIDPALEETSLETGEIVHNVVRVRCQPGAAGTILNNLAALGIGTLYPIAFLGQDAEGHELHACLNQLPGVNLEYLQRTPLRRTFCYTKPLVLRPDQPPRELNRLDFKNWSATPAAVEEVIIQAVRKLAPQVDAMIVLDQVDVPETGVVTTRVREVLGELASLYPHLFIIADSRRGLQGFPPLSFKMNARELAVLTGASGDTPLNQLRFIAQALAARHRRPIFVTLAERGILGASADGSPVHLDALPVRGEIDIVGAGDAVMANLSAAMASGAELSEALELANAAASIVIHQLGTTGTASVGQLAARLT